MSRGHAGRVMSDMDESQSRNKRVARRIDGVRFVPADETRRIVGGCRSHLYTLARNQGWRTHREGQRLWYAEADVRRTPRDRLIRVAQGWQKRRACFREMLGDGWLPVAEAATRLGVRVNRLREWIGKGMLPAARRFGTLTVRRSDLAALRARLAGGLRRLKGHLTAGQARAFAARVEACKVLSAREREVLQLHYGLAGESPVSRKAIGQRYGVTRQAIQIIEEHALRKIEGIPGEVAASQRRQVGQGGRDMPR